jgi:hypothetical protein
VCGDYSEPMRPAFRQWLTRRYGDDSGLRAAWGDANAMIAAAEVPSAAEQLENRNGTFRDAKREARTIDYFRCLADLSADAVIDFCRTVKQAAGPDKLAGAFYGYLMELAWNGGFFAERADSIYTTYQRSGHIGLRRVLAAPEVDFLVSPYSYGFRGIGGDGPSMVPAESARLHGKLVLIEDDTRTHIGTDHNYGQATDLAKSIAILRRNFAQAMTRGQGMWWASWQVDATREPGFQPVLRDFERIGNLLVETDRTPASEVAVLLDDESLLYESCLENFDVPGIFQQKLWGLAHTGAPFDTYLLDDLVEGRVPPYRLYVFLNAFRVDAGRREKLARQLRRDGRVALWIYAPGYAGEAGLESMRELTGFRFGRGERPWGPLVHLTAFDHAITRGLPQDLTWGTSAKLSPPFYIDDPEPTVLGEVVYSQGNCKPGFVVRGFGEWTSVYSAAPAVPAPVLRSLARFAGVHLYEEAGDNVYASRNLVGIHTAGGGPRTVRLRARAQEVVDVFARRTVARDAERFDVVLPPASTALYYTGTREFAARLKAL